MQTEAVFENIAERILEEICTAQKSIFIAVAWFTNKSLFIKLVEKANEGCNVSLIISNDPINQNSSIDYNRLNTVNSRIYMVGNGDMELMHNKFCVIDYNCVITGSYNWSYKAESNFENIIITTDDTRLADQFISEFNNIRKQYFPNEAQIEIQFSLSKIIKRLEILKNYIMLEDVDELIKEANKLKAINFNIDIDDIIQYVYRKEFSEAIEKIQDFINRNHQITVWTDPIIIALKLEIKILENQLTAFDNEKTDLEKVLSTFHHRHAKELGDIILEILRIRKLKFIADQEKQAEAEEDERKYWEQLKTEKENEIFELTDFEKQELKNKYRKSAVLCHPDKFVNESLEIQKQAEEIFKELNEANEKNDLKRVAEILAYLEKGILSTSKSDKLADKEKLRATVNKLREKVRKLEAQIIAIKQSESFRTVTNIENWDEYFINVKEKLQKELEQLKLEIEK